ncbi:MAG: HlyD family secretion protein, partial [Muribaculaceae bacterium]|nr:HlyD family secretion protein [Muribaculaceae bacterium]
MDKEIPIKERRKRKIKSWCRFGAVVLAVVAGLMWFAGASRQSVKLDGLSTGVTDVGTIETTVNASGRVKPGMEEIVTSPISSRIMKVYKKAGEQVEEGEPIIQLDLTNVQTQYDQMVDEMRMKELQLEQLRINTESSLREQQMHLRVKEMSVNRLEMDLRKERYLDSLGSGTGDNV